MADVVEQVREMIVGTTWPEAAIAARVGIGVGTVHAWKTRRKWPRPPGASVSTRKVAASRAGFTRRSGEALRRLEEMASGEILRLCHEGHAAATECRAALQRAVAIIVGTRGALRPVPPRAAWLRLEALAAGEAERLAGIGTPDPVAIERARGLAAIARLKRRRRLGTRGREAS